MQTEFSDYIIYVDESGDHHLEKVDEGYPLFCLAFCIIKKSDYINKIVPAIQQLKFDFWGHDKVVLHERELRKQEREFGFLRNTQKSEAFYTKLNRIMSEASFWVTSAVIKKNHLKERYEDPFNPYHIALKICMENAYGILLKEGQEGKKVHCVFERRGKKEDALLELEFYRTAHNQNDWGYRIADFSRFDFQILFAGKEHNSTGLQLADLVARPIATKILRPQQCNRAHDIISTKYYHEFANKVFP